jgi:hypothetical protein
MKLLVENEIRRFKLHKTQVLNHQMLVYLELQNT